MNIRFTVITLPTFVRDAEGRRTGKGGTFQTSQRIERDLWKKLDGHFISREEEEDGVGSEGWNYDVKALCTVIKNGNGVVVDGVTCNTDKELFDALESVPARRAEREQAQQQKADALKSERVLLASKVESETGLKETTDWSWDDIRYAVEDVISESDHFFAQRYTFRNLTDGPKRDFGFIIKSK